MSDVPYMTADLPGVGGRMKDSPDDFVVEELPLYLPSGEGTHVYFRVAKVGLPTPAAVGRIARHMGVRASEIGVAGLKDAQARTVQMMSLEHADEAKLAAFKDPRIALTVVGRHGNKIRPGHLAGNRFTILIRGVGAEREKAARAILDVLSERGVPNFFGSQRFGVRGDTALLGEALVRDDLDEFVALLLGRASEGDPPDCKAARDAFDAGFYERAMKCWPRHYTDQRRALAAYKKRRHAGPAAAAVDKRMRRLYVSAFQSEMFNEIVAARMDTLDTVLAGDLACKTDTGGVFLVEDVEAETKRASAFEISPTGPVFGYRSTLAEGEPGRIEREVLAARGVELKRFKELGSLRSKGTRRALRFRLCDVELASGVDERGEYLRLGFTAASGSYATVALREIMKNDQPSADES